MQVCIEILKETQKAVEVRSVYFLSLGWCTVWLPKSQIKIEENIVIEVADWLVKKIKAEYGCQAPYWCAKESF